MELNNGQDPRQRLVRKSLIVGHLVAQAPDFLVQLTYTVLVSYFAFRGSSWNSKVLVLPPPSARISKSTGPSDGGRSLAQREERFFRRRPFMTKTSAASRFVVFKASHEAYIPAAVCGCCCIQNWACRCDAAWVQKGALGQKLPYSWAELVNSLLGAHTNVRIVTDTRK